VYTAWGGFAYGRGLDGAPAADDMNRQYRRIAVAAKNTDTREHDIADSDDYFQYHGGMAATVDYLFGYDATAGVMADWMYERLSAEYVLDGENRKFIAESNPWALHG